MKPLSNKTRNISMGIMLFIFVVMVPILIAYSSGYRFSVKDFGFSKTGGIFVHSDLIGTKVFIDGEFFEDNGLILRSTLIQNLKSEQIYKIRVEKEGYYPWYKDLSVYPNLVTEGTVMMIPIDIEFDQIQRLIKVPATSIEAIASTTEIISPDYKDVYELFVPATSTEEVLLTVQTPFNNLSPTTSIDIATNTKPLLPSFILDLDIEDIENKEMVKESGKMVAWIENGDVDVVWGGKEDATPFFFCDIRGCRDKILVSLDTDISYYDFFPDRNDALVVGTENHIFAVEIDDRSRQNLQTIYEGKNPEFRLVGNTIFIKDGEELYKADI